MIDRSIMNEALERYYELHGVAKNLGTIGIDDEALAHMLVAYSEDGGLESIARVNPPVDALMMGLVSGFTLGAMAARLEASESGTGGSHE